MDCLAPTTKSAILVLQSTGRSGQNAVRMIRSGEVRISSKDMTRSHGFVTCRSDFSQSLSELWSSRGLSCCPGMAHSVMCTHQIYSRSCAVNTAWCHGSRRSFDHATAFPSLRLILPQLFQLSSMSISYHCSSDDAELSSTSFAYKTSTTHLPLRARASLVA